MAVVVLMAVDDAVCAPVRRVFNKNEKFLRDSYLYTILIIIYTYSLAYINMWFKMMMIFQILSEVKGLLVFIMIFI